MISSLRTFSLICIFAIVFPFSSLQFFFFNDTATTEIYTLSLHDALPILGKTPTERDLNDVFKVKLNFIGCQRVGKPIERLLQLDRKSTRLNSSHQIISYAVFCLKKKKYQD